MAGVIMQSPKNSDTPTIPSIISSRRRRACGPAFSAPAPGELIHDLTVISCTDGWLGSPLPPGGEMRYPCDMIFASVSLAVKAKRLMYLMLFTPV